MGTHFSPVVSPERIDSLWRRLWLIFPSIIVYTLGKDIAHYLWAASRLSDGGRVGGKKGAKVE